MTSDDCECGYCDGVLVENDKLVARWVRQFNVGPSRRREMTKALTDLMEQLEREVRAEMPSEITKLKVDTYWFERQVGRKPERNEVRPWHATVDFKDGLNVTGTLGFSHRVGKFEDTVATIKKEIWTTIRKKELLGKPTTITITI